MSGENDRTRQFTGEIADSFMPPGPWPNGHSSVRLPVGMVRLRGLFLIRDTTNAAGELGKVVSVPHEYPGIPNVYLGREYWYWAGAPWPDAFEVHATFNRDLPGAAFESYTFDAFGDAAALELQADTFAIQTLADELVGYLDLRTNGIAWWGVDEHLTEKGGLPMVRAPLRFTRLSTMPEPPNPPAEPLRYVYTPKLAPPTE